MTKLNNIINYWLDCIRNEDILGKGISPLSRSKAIIYPFKNDCFVFNPEQLVTDQKNIVDFYTYSNTNKYDVFFGYPLYYYYDKKQEKYLLAPVFIVQLNLSEDSGKIVLCRTDSTPTCGIQVLEEYGLKSEQIADLSSEIEKTFKSAEQNDLVSTIMSIYSRDVGANIVEEIDPGKLTNDKKLTRECQSGIYNKSALFVGDSSSYNMHLLNDLTSLSEKNDLEDTALSYINGDSLEKEKNCFLPIFPYPINEYQMSAIESCCRYKLSVVTGPPGTGKSQFIANLIISLFMADQKVLFVSHTGEAVDVVNGKLNSFFENLMIRTGKKELRQDLKGKFSHILQSNTSGNDASGIQGLLDHWSLIQENHKLLKERSKLDQKYSELFFVKKELGNLCNCGNFIKTIKNRIKHLIVSFRLEVVERRLNKISEKSELEKRLVALYSDYFIKSKKTVADNYINKMLGDGFYIDDVNMFIGSASAVSRPGMEHHKPLGALEILRVWSCTLKSLRATFDLKPNMFDYVIFDEASQVDLPSAAPALYRAKNVVVVGDPNQLTHIASITPNQDENIAGKHGLSKNTYYKSRIRYCDVSLYKSAENSIKHAPVFLLNHYRSEDSIIELCNQTFYGGRLKIRTRLSDSSYPKKLMKGVHWINVRGKSEKRKGGSRYNIDEAREVAKILKQILSDSEGYDISVGVVTPYSAQQDLIYKLINSTISEDLIKRSNLKILTAHKFQGSERDIMIFSPVLASSGNGNDDRWFNIYPQILNVALSRAKRLLYIVGDKNYCSDHKCYAGDKCILKRLSSSFDGIVDQANQEKYNIESKFDTPVESFLYNALQKINIEKKGYRIIPKYVAKRYTLDFAIMKGDHKINIECDGKQHEIIGGIPIVEDVERDDFLTNDGWTILRYSNYRILSDTSNVIKEIAKQMV